MPIFRRRRGLTEREIREPDWTLIVDHLDEDEEQVDTCKGWSIGGPVDHPCAVYLTDRSIYVDVNPDASLTGAQTIVIPFSTIGKCGIGASDMGTPRLVIVFDPSGESDPENVQTVGVDLRPEERGWQFGEQVVKRFEANGESSTQGGSADSGDVPEAVQEMQAEDPEAFAIAHQAVQDWLEAYSGIAEAAGRSDGGATGPVRMLVEAFAAATAVREALDAGRGAAEPHALFGEQVAIAQEQQRSGAITKQWAVAFLQIRCFTVVYMLGRLRYEDEAEAFAALFKAFSDTSEAP